MLRPTRQARKGFNPNGYGPGVMAPFGVSKTYPRFHNGQDYFWLSPASAQKLGMTSARSKVVYAVVNGKVVPQYNNGLGNGAYQQIDPTHRAYWWHLAKPVQARTATTNTAIGVMGHTGTSAGNADHLHFEVRKAPYREQDRINPEPFFTTVQPSPPAQSQGSKHMKLIKETINGVDTWSMCTGFAILSTTSSTEAARWQAMTETGSPQTANVTLIKSWWDQIIQANINAVAVGSGGFTPTDRAVLNDIPTAGELGQALTSTVALVADQLDTYNISLNVNAVPGTATGTATRA